MRKTGILMPIASLPDRHGCGTFGPQAYRFVDQMKEAGIHIWQILPLNPLGYGNSPYQPYSSFAMDELYISLDLLHQQGLIDDVPSFHRRDQKIAYEEVRAYRQKYLRQAYENFKEDHNFAVFSYQGWVKSFAMFMAFKKRNNMRPWTEWPSEMKDAPQSETLNLKEYEDDILYEVFLQYVLYLQWKDLKQYANDRDIEIVGDIPFYVGLDSADVWGNRANFLLEDDGRPSFIAGVPPDYFSATGQRWGNPIYNWDYMKEDGFTFWMERLSYIARLFDRVRVDHFRAFDTYWKIPSSCPTAMEGAWIEAPGYELFDTLFAANPEVEILAEDLGDLRPEVLTLRDHYNFRGMRVIQFSFDASGMPEDKEHLLVYTGTHDNMPIYTWYREKSNAERRAMRNCLKRLGYTEKSFVDNVIAYSLDSNADMVIIPMMDWLHSDKEARLNTPGTVGMPNWAWRMTDFTPFTSKIAKIRAMIEKSGRAE